MTVDGRAGGVLVRVQRTNLNDDFTIMPNDLLRGEGHYEHISAVARQLLAAGLTCRDNWEATLAKIEKWLPPMGRDRHEDVRRELREHGFLSMFRTQLPPGHEQAGKYVWTLQFFMDALPPADRDVLQEKKPRVKKPPRGAPLCGPGLPGAVDQSEESAGQPMPGQSGHRSPGHRSPGPEHQGDVVLKEPVLKRTTPPSPPDDPAADEDAAAATKGGKLPIFDEQTREMLAAARAEAVRIRSQMPKSRKAWTADAVQEAMLEALQADWSPDQVAWAIRRAAMDASTMVPGRITAPAWMEQALSERFVPAPAPRDAGEKCRNHPGNLVGTCTGCKVDRALAEAEKRAEEKRRAAADEPAPADDGKSAAAAAAQEAAQATAAAATRLAQRVHRDGLRATRTPGQRAAGGPTQGALV